MSLTALLLHCWLFAAHYENIHVITLISSWKTCSDADITPMSLSHMACFARSFTSGIADGFLVYKLCNAMTAFLRTISLIKGQTH